MSDTKQQCPICPMPNGKHYADCPWHEQDAPSGGPTCPYCHETMVLGDGSYWCMNKKCAEQFYPSGNDELFAKQSQPSPAVAPSGAREWLEWVEPFGPNNEPVFMRVHKSTAIAKIKSLHPASTDEQALDDFIAVNWAQWIEPAESLTAPLREQLANERKISDNCRQDASRVGAELTAERTKREAAERERNKAQNEWGLMKEAKEAAERELKEVREKYAHSVQCMDRNCFVCNAAARGTGRAALRGKEGK